MPILYLIDGGCAANDMHDDTNYKYYIVCDEDALTYADDKILTHIAISWKLFHNDELWNAIDKEFSSGRKHKGKRYFASHDDKQSDTTVIMRFLNTVDRFVNPVPVI